MYLSIIATLLGTFVGYLMYKLSKRKEELDYRQYIQNIFQNLFELDKMVNDNLAKFKQKLASLNLTSEVDFSTSNDTYELILEFAKLEIEDLRKQPILMTMGAEISNLHYYNQNTRNILLYKIEDFYSRHSKVLNNYEVYMCLLNLLIFKDARVPTDKYYCQAIKFYNKMLTQKDFLNFFRMGIFLTGFEIDSRKFPMARDRISKLENMKEINSINNSKFYIERIKFLKNRSK